MPYVQSKEEGKLSSNSLLALSGIHKQLPDQVERVDSRLSKASEVCECLLQPLDRALACPETCSHILISMLLIHN
jgi:hypothetical protein